MSSNMLDVQHKAAVKTEPQTVSLLWCMLCVRERERERPQAGRHQECAERDHSQDSQHLFLKDGALSAHVPRSVISSAL